MLDYSDVKFHFDGDLRKKKNKIQLKLSNYYFGGLAVNDNSNQNASSFQTDQTSTHDCVAPSMLCLKCHAKLALTA